MRPSLGESNMGALAGAIVGAIGGLFAIGLAPALIARKPALLFDFPILGLVCWLVCGPMGWLIGGQVGPRLASRLAMRRAEIVGGAVGGLVPVTLIALWGWYMVTPH